MSCSIYRSSSRRNETNPATKHTMTPGIPLMSVPQIPMRQQRGTGRSRSRPRKARTSSSPSSCPCPRRFCVENSGILCRPCHHWFIWRMHCSSVSLRIQLVTWADHDCSRGVIATASIPYYRWISVRLPVHLHASPSAHRPATPNAV